MRKRGQGREGAATSRHLERISDAVRSGAHAVLHGHLRDDVLLDGQIVDETWGVGRILEERNGISWLFVANQADGTFCVDPEREESAEDFFSRLSPTDALEHRPSLRSTDPFGLAEALRLLLRQEERPVAVLLEDPAALFGSDDRDTRLALGILMEGVTEASFFGRREGVTPRNALIAYGVPDGPAVEAIAGLPGVEEVLAEPPSYDERLAVLRELRQSFFREGNGGQPSREDLEVLASMTDGRTLQSLRGLSRVSHAVRVPATRPETLYRRSRGESTVTPLGKVGVAWIMEKLAEEIRGQQETLAAVERRLEVGCWRPANRPRGLVATRPMATLVLHGPPGVGKTETALVLAEALVGSRGALQRIDCSEMRNPHDIARLTGAPPGYVGYSEGGALTEALEQDAAVILFDEFDRAHPGLTETLLGILDAGRLTDGRGRTATFENAILLFTTNRGFREGETPNLDYRSLPGREEFVEENEANLKDAVENGPKDSRGNPEHPGSPALWSRLQSALVGYDILRPEAVEEIVASSCRRLEVNIADEYDVAPELADDGFASAIVSRVTELPKWDGRTVYAMVQQLIEAPVRVALRDRSPSAGSVVRFGAGEDGRAVRL